MQQELRTHSHHSETVGLCARCQHAQVIRSAKGSTFILCTLSKTDPSFPKYPRLPILSCRGFQEKETTTEQASSQQ